MLRMQASVVGRWIGPGLDKGAGGGCGGDKMRMNLVSGVRKGFGGNIAFELKYY